MADTDMTRFTPAPVKGGVVAYLQLDGAIKAVEFYRDAFGGEIASILQPDANGRTMHAHVYVNGSSIMLSDPCPEQGVNPQSPQGFNLTIMVDDIDTWWQRAVAAGCETVMPVADMFWGARYGMLRDPFGVIWAMNQQVAG
jgi:PhnB protein